jgi:hypothetical protein
MYIVTRYLLFFILISNLYGAFRSSTHCFNDELTLALVLQRALSRMRTLVYVMWWINEDE